MNWASFTKKQQQMIMAIAVMAVVQIVVMAHFFGWTKPASERGGTARNELTELEQKVTDARAIIRQEASIRNNLSQGIAKLEVLAKYAPTVSDRYAWAYEYVSRCAMQARVTFNNFEEATLNSGDKGDVSDQPYEIHITALCDYNSLVEFLWRLEKDNPLLRIKKVNIASAQGISLAHRVQIDIQWMAALKVERGTE